MSGEMGKNDLVFYDIFECHSFIHALPTLATPAISI